MFQPPRELVAVAPAPRAQWLLELRTEMELVTYYAVVWNARQLIHVVVRTLGS